MFTFVYLQNNPPELFQYNQSTFQAFYFFKNVLIDSILVEPDDSRSLAIAIQSLRLDSDLSSRLVDNAAILVAEYSWSSRSDRILEFVNSIVGLSSD